MLWRHCEKYQWRGTPRERSPAMEVRRNTMSIISDTNGTARDAKAVKIVAKSIYRELQEGGFADQDVIALAGELLTLVANGVKARRTDEES
jgi:hypothetical protein